MSRAVLDASAALAYLLGEPGAAVVTSVLLDAAIGAINASEVITKLMERVSPGTARADFQQLGLDVIPFDLRLAMLTADLRAPTRSAGLSLGDRACLALGRQMRLPVYTADRRWATVDVGVEVRLIR